MSKSTVTEGKIPWAACWRDLGAETDEPGIDQDWGMGGIEPPLQELMNDPMMHLLLRRDGLTSKAVWQFVEQERDRLGKTGRSHRRSLEHPSGLV